MTTHNGFTLLVMALGAIPTGPAGAGGGGKDAAREAREELQGTWRASTVSYNGKDFYEKGQATFDFIVKGDEIIVQGNDAVKKEYARFKYKLDPSTMPKIFDLTVTGGIQLNVKMEGIYEVNGEEFKLCVRIF